MKLAIVGSRDYPNLNLVIKFISMMAKKTVIVSGGAKGVDKCAEETAKHLGMGLEVYPANWDNLEGAENVKINKCGKKYDPAAGYRRNIKIVESADKVVAFWSGTKKSKGTLHTISIAIADNKLLKIFGPDGCEIDPATLPKP